MNRISLFLACFFVALVMSVSGCGGSSGSTVIAPAIVTQPEDRTIALMESTTLSVVATGTDLEYQWNTFDGSGLIPVPVPGGTSATLELGPFDSEFSETYFVRITNSAGMVDSRTVTVHATNGGSSF